MNEQRETDLGLVDDAMQIEEGLDDWELPFIEDQDKWLKTHDTLTDKQRAKLKQILQAKG